MAVITWGETADQEKRTEPWEHPDFKERMEAKGTSNRTEKQQLERLKINQKKMKP